MRTNKPHPNSNNNFKNHQPNNFTMNTDQNQKKREGNSSSPHKTNNPSNNSNNSKVQSHGMIRMQGSALNQSSAASPELKRNSLRKVLEKMMGITIGRNDLDVIITKNYGVIIGQLSKMNLDSMEKVQSVQFLKNQVNSQRLKDDYFFVKDIIVPQLIIALGITACKYDSNVNMSSEDFPEEKTYDLRTHPLPNKERVRLIQLAPKLSSGSAYISMELDSVDVLTRLFYDLIKTSKKFFAKMNFKIVYEKNGFENMDFTSLKKTLESNKIFVPALEKFKKLKGFRNEWAHFTKPSVIPPEVIMACFNICREIYNAYGNITGISSDAKGYIQRKMDLLSMFEKDYKILESKPKLVSGIVAQFCTPEKKKQSALKVIEILSERVKKESLKSEEKDVDRLYNEILLNLLPRSPYLLREMKRLTDNETPREDMMIILLKNEFESRIKRDEQFVKSCNPMCLSDQRFISKSVFFKSLVNYMFLVSDSRQKVFEKAYNYHILEKCLNSLKDQNIEEATVQKFKQIKEITTPKEAYDIVLQEINSQVESFRNLWIAIAYAFRSCCYTEIADAIKYLSWSLTEMTMTNKFHFPQVIRPYIELALNYLFKCNATLANNLIFDQDINSLKILIQVCLASLLKFKHTCTEISDQYFVLRTQILNLDPNLLQQLDQADKFILYADPENIKKESLLQVKLQFSRLKKNDRANISVEGCSAFANAEDILN